ncbi:hypothetical protein JX580_01035 [Thiomicrospira microaerophila]|uniref:hypothetical protein n=1 Tax=Thiomicrospira microaerophila TaxID=406020 RepID=UPI00200EE94F|nr:hypothetical protein [Thiomicrospira microaerophila]UQB42530.1 hypothetical protein JX580_01035 [Thiomicrospira microaerophila]
MRLFAGLILLALLSACASKPTKNTGAIQFHSQEQAIATLAQALEDEGFITKPLNSQQLEVFYGNHAYIMEPRIRPNQLSRIIVSQVYPVKPQHINNPELFVTLSRLNNHLTCAKYLMQPGNKAAEVQSSITFIDEKLDIREVTLFMNWMQTSVQNASSLVPPGTLDMFEF